MKKHLKHIGLATLAATFLVSCEGTIGSDEPLDFNTNINVAGFSSVTTDANVVSDGEEKTFKVEVLVDGPTVNQLEGDVTLTFTVDPSSTAVAGTDYVLDSNSLVLEDKNNYLGQIPITILTAGKTPPETRTLVLDIETIQTGEETVVLSGNANQIVININYLCFSDVAGTYTTTAGSFTPITVTQTGPGEYLHSALPGLSAGGSPIPFAFVVSCGEISINTLVLGGGYLVKGDGMVNPDGSFVIVNYQLFNGPTEDTGVFFDFTGINAVYVPQ